MMKWILACAVVTVTGLWAESASAQESIQAPAQVVAPTPTVTTVTRTGLFGRVRARRQMVVVSEPAMMTTPAPMAKPMPSSVQPAQGTKAPTTTVQQSGYLPLQGGTQQPQGTMPAAGTTMPATVMAPEYYVAPRMGLFARMRARRGM